MSSIFRNLLVLTAALLASPVFAQTITIGSNSGLPGATVVVPVNFTAGSNVAGVDMDLTFTASQFSAVTVDCSVQTVSASNTSNFCSDASAGTGKIDIILAKTVTNVNFTSGLLANVSFTIANGATVGDKTLTGEMKGVSDNQGDPLALNTVAITNGKVTVQAGPQPTFSSSPVSPGGNINLASAPEGGTNPTANINITNTGAATTQLDGTCAMGAGNAQITLTSDGAFSIVQGAAADVQTVSCSAAARGNFSRTLTCPHDGSNGPNATYTVNCTITGPAYTSNPVAGSPLTFTATEQNDPDPTKTISVTNTGPAGTLLDVTCTDTVDPDGVFSVTGGAFLDLSTAGPAKVVTVTCDSAGSVATHTGTLSCDHNGTNAPDPATYALSCEITPPGAAIYKSVPVPTSTINLTPTPVVEGTNVTALPLVISNDADIGDSDLSVECTLAGASQITQSGIDDGGPFTLAPKASDTANFDCNASASGSYSATYDCNYFSVTPVKAGLLASYTVKCDVREPEAVVEPTPPSGTPQQAVVAPGGSHTFSFVFAETANEGVDGTLETCTLVDGTNYSIIAPVSFPVTIDAGGSVTVQVQGIDPGGVDSFADTLNCTYTNGPLAEPVEDRGNGGNVTYPLNIVIGGDASFLVTKEFTDGNNPTEVEVTISCNTGLPIIQSQTISETQEVTFIVQSFETGELNCNITEDLSDPALAGYTPSYYFEQGEPDPDSCEYTEVNGGDENNCHIVNDADPVPVVIEKDWIIDGIGGDQIDQRFELTLYCDSEIVGADPVRGPAQVACSPAEPLVTKGANGYKWESCLELEGNGDTTFTPEVIPKWPGTHCWVDEDVYDDAAEVANGCLDIEVSHGQGDECLITNTVFFEGIPTLSQYGMAIMALLMLGFGLVGFRRFI